MPRPATHRSITRSGSNSQAELGWLLDDAIQEIGEADKGSMRSKKMSRVLALGTADAEQLSVSMRIALCELDRLWQQRIRERQAPPWPASNLSSQGILPRSHVYSEHVVANLGSLR